MTRAFSALHAAAIVGRRSFLASASLLTLAGPALARVVSAGNVRAEPAPLSSVRLLPSVWATAVERNRRTLLDLQPDRLLHNFHASAGLLPKAERYGGWEARGIAGHTLGHYLSATALMIAQTGDPAVRERLTYTIAELARIQVKHGDGYIGGTTVERGGKDVDGKIVFEEIRRGEIRTGGFDINGGWVPLYTWHKVHAGLIDADRHAGIAAARPVMLGMACYLATILEGLDDAQLQRLLAAEYGGLNDSYAETFALTGDPRWLKLAERIRDRRVLDPLAEGRNTLPGLHANTQIPKVIGLARLHELTGNPAQGGSARFFHRIVVGQHSYVIGGNSEREHFRSPGVIAQAITERTCEACNSYNMLKLTRHLHGWQPNGALMDYYERAHLNHILAHQHPQTGRFVYFMPLSSGAKRTYSTEEDSFWCCVGSGLESHSKHGESVWWHDGATLYVGLYIPSRLDWRGVKARLETQFPFEDHATLTVEKAHAGTRAVALRLPGWSEGVRITLNGRPATFDTRDGYAVLTRRWKAGDQVAITMPMRVRSEATPDDPRTAAFLYGPMVLSADLGAASEPFDQPVPALVTADVAASLTPISGRPHEFRMADARPEPLTLKPFFAQYDNRTAVYFPRFTEAEWLREEAAFTATQAEQAALAARTVDVIELGEMQPERDHAYASNHSDLFSFAGRSARQLPWGVGHWLEFSLGVGPGSNTLRVLYWGEEVDKHFTISIDGTQIATERRKATPEKKFVGVDYPVPFPLTRGKDKVRVRVETRGTDAFLYEARMLGAAQTGD